MIKMIIKERSLTMRHVSRTHRVALDWFFDRITSDSKIRIKYIDTRNQLADILTKGNFTRDEWNRLLCFSISHFRSINCSEVMSKRAQKDSVEERVTAKSKPTMNLVSRCSERTPDVLASTASESPGKSRHESQLHLSPWNEHQPRTERPVMDACSSNYSEWNTDKNWSSQEWKSDELVEVRTGRLVYEQPPGSFTVHTDKFVVVDDDDMDTNTFTESDLSFKFSKQDDSTLQSIHSMHRWPSFQGGSNEILEIFPKCAIKLFWSVYTWHVLDDPIFYGQWTNLHDRLQNGMKHVTDDYLVWYLTYSSHMWIQSVLLCGKHC